MAMNTYNPAQVMLRQPSDSTGSDLMRSGVFGGAPKRPYLPVGGISQMRRSPGSEGSAQQAPTMPSSTIGPESVRASGSGPFDAAYRQNLATYAGGQFARPGGNLSFNPTSGQMPGQPTGGGNAPVGGLPTGLLDMALGGNPFSFTPQAATPSASASPNYWKFWLGQYNQPFNAMRGARNTY
jgi:hypothetical protein